ncbi:hypothetical protein ACRARG_05790 [Pseudooceanicola sp. C21-150M6]|uniref:hypothetical protein n=1 Tax=Pseudooceanicola sp. C21-150M6 TaxID=3434355 RepID=UPI003D7F9BB3
MTLNVDTKDPIELAFRHLTRDHVDAALALIDRHGEDWVQHKTGRRRKATRYLNVQGRSYPLKATGYLAAQIAGNIDRTDGSPVNVERVITCFCKLGYEVT